MKENYSRRKFLSATAKSGAALTLGTTLLHLSSCTRNVLGEGTGLLKDPKGICDLPEGFSYKAFSKYGDIMNDGHIVPDYHDGMGCFHAPDGGLILVRNHEIPWSKQSTPTSPDQEFAYDPTAGGGTVTIWLDDNLEVQKQYLSLTGTIVNCGGGATPWGTWISCEEAGYSGWQMEKRHAYNFEVDPTKPLQQLEPLTAMGRFNHEAIAVDAQTGIVYQTEDNVNGCFYRFIPNVAGKLSDGGTLQALRIDDGIAHTTQQQLELGKKYPCSWVTIDEPDPEENTVHLEAQQKGAAVFVRGEGIVAHEDGVYFSCTQGGKHHQGQIFKYGFDSNHGWIQLVYEANKKSIIEKPDNITLSHHGDLIICEDSGRKTQYMTGLTPEGKTYYIAANHQSEWAGACFSPDGKTLFANIHKNPGVTVAIQGPWEQLRTQV